MSDEKTNLPARKVVVGKVVTGKAERIERKGLFDYEPNVVEPCEICGGMHDSEVLTVCALKRAKRMVEADRSWGDTYDGDWSRSGD